MIHFFRVVLYQRDTLTCLKLNRHRVRPKGSSRSAKWQFSLIFNIYLKKCIKKEAALRVAAQPTRIEKPFELGKPIALAKKATIAPLGKAKEKTKEYFTAARFIF